AKQDSDTVNITVNAVNDPPVNSVPAAQSVTEDSSLTFNTTNGNRIQVTDVDAANADTIQVTLTATNGTITLPAVNGLTFSVGDGSADATMTFTASRNTINSRLSGLVYTPTANYFGAATLQITTDDQGNTGSGGAQSDTDTINITVNGVNDAPVNSVPAAQTVNEDTSLVFSSGNGNL